MANDKLTYYVNASLLKEAACASKMLFTCVEGLQLQGENKIKMEYGNAFHLFLAELYKGKDAKEEAWPSARDYYKEHEHLIRGDEFRTMSHLGMSCAAYVKAHQHEPSLEILLDNKGKPFIESRFALPWFSCADFDIVLVGTIDMLAEINGIPCIVDHKTTGMRQSSFFAKYDFEIQSTFYSWIMREHYKMDTFMPFVVNGLFIKAPTQAYYKGKKEFDGISFERSAPYEFEPDKMEEFEAWLRFKLEWIKGHIEMQHANPRHAFLPSSQERSFCDAHFGTCKFQGICNANPEYRENVIEGDYVREPYDPTTWH